MLMFEQLLEKLSPVKSRQHSFCSAIILAAGKGRRMESSVNKVYIDLLGKKTIVRTLESFQQSPFIDEIILVVGENDITYCGFEVIDKLFFTKVKEVVGGGVSRQESVYNGLQAVSKDAKLISIHDGARPLVTEEILERSIQGALEFGAVTTGVPVKDTIKVINNEGYVTDTPDRNKLWAVQTPQVFKRNIIFEAHKQGRELGIEATDDAMLVENLGHRIKIIEGSYENIKLTTPEDAIIARAIINDREIGY